MSARPMTKGGVMIGSSVRARSERFQRKFVRVTTNAKQSPRLVQVMAVVAPR